MKVVFKVGYYLGTASFYLGLGLLLYNFKSSLLSAANPSWRSGINGGMWTLCYGFDSYSRYYGYSWKIEGTYTFMTIF